MKITLYQFLISHYCEKIRWALDHKGLEYQCKNLLPGLHLRTTKKMAPKTYVPILMDGKTQVQNSHIIINYLDETYPECSLTPRDPQLHELALHWEKFADVEIGPHIRRYCYHILLDYPEILIPLFTKDGPWWAPWFYKFGYKKLAKVIRKVMNINEDSARESQAKIQSGIDIVYQAYSKNDFLAGDQFTRADLTVAAMLAPLFTPEGFGLDWPDSMPPRLNAFIKLNQEKMQRLEQLYLQYR